MKYLLLLPILGLVACNATQQAQVAADLQTVSKLCGQAMALGPVAGPIAPYIIGACATEGAIAKIAEDPSTVDWLNKLIADTKIIAKQA